MLQPLSSDEGSIGGGIGYRGISPSVAVEFDTYGIMVFQEPLSHHSAVIYDGIPWGPHSNLYIFPNSIEDDKYHDVVFTWTASTNILTVSWDGTTIITLEKDIVTDIFSGDPKVYYGFTAATGASY